MSALIPIVQPDNGQQILIKKGSKVLVHSRFREVKVAVGRTYGRHPTTGRTEISSKFRTFKDNRAYMTPEEAAFVVESDENMRHDEYRLPMPYTYPAGAPFPVPYDKDGPFFAAESDDALMAGDPRAMLAADKIREEAAIALQAQDEAAAQLAADTAATAHANANPPPAATGGGDN